MRLRGGGLQASFVAMALGALLVALAAIGLMLHHQQRTRAEVLALSQQSMHALAEQRVLERGEAISVQLADALVNPLYYFDLDAMGSVVRNVLQQPDVAYVLVFDTAGNVVHDGSSDIDTYGRRMDDAFAAEAIAARGRHMQHDGRLLDVAMPIRMGEQRIGGVRIG